MITKCKLCALRQAQEPNLCQFVALYSALIRAIRGFVFLTTQEIKHLNREVAGLEYLPNVDKVAWNLRDWTNVSGADQDPLGWSDRDLGNPAGVWHIGSRASGVFHNARTSNTLFPSAICFFVSMGIAISGQ